MSIKINRALCNGCGKAQEPGCVSVCPGDLLFKDNENRCAIRDARDCWDCAACVKECPRQAIELTLPTQIGGRGASLKAKRSSNSLEWLLNYPDGRTEVFKVVVKEGGTI
ncbi:MAG: 4Fe-4S dicluster domain-containing protein [Candidatus Saccharibacteria bacterium]